MSLISTCINRKHYRTPLELFVAFPPLVLLMEVLLEVALYTVVLPPVVVALAVALDVVDLLTEALLMYVLLLVLVRFIFNVFPSSLSKLPKANKIQAA